MRPIRFIAILCFAFVVGTWVDSSGSYQQHELVSVETSDYHVDSDATFHWDGDVNYAVIIITPDFEGEGVEPDVGLSDITSSDQVHNKGPTILNYV